MPNRPPVHQPPGLAEAKAREVIERDRRRGSAAKRGYGRRWQRARLVHLKLEPLCRHCRQAGRITAATEVDHIIPHKGDRELFWDAMNWQSLCHACHSRKTLSEQQQARGGSNLQAGPAADPRPSAIFTRPIENSEVKIG